MVELFCRTFLEEINMSNAENKQTVDKNLIYIGLFSLIIVIALIAIMCTKCSDGNSNTGNNAAVATTKKSIYVQSENGDKNGTIDADIKLRDISFSKSINKIKKYESKQKDTVGEPSIAESQDGYTYLTYKFDSSNPPAFFGTTVSTQESSALLVYVFRNDKLIEVRFQYGNIGPDAYNSIVSNIASTYGQSTYSRTYSNGAQESWWKTKDITLDVICQDLSVIAYYRLNQ